MFRFKAILYLCSYTFLFFSPSIFSFDFIDVIPAKAFSPMDLNGDGMPNYFYKHLAENYYVAIDYNPDTNKETPLQLGSGFFGPQYKLDFTGDFNGDGAADVVLRANNGASKIWFMNQLQDPDQANFPPYSDPWQPLAVVDADQDGIHDVVMVNNDYNGNSYVQVWLMNGNQVNDYKGFINNAEWELRAVGQFDDESDKLSFFFINTDTKDVVIWVLNNNVEKEKGIVLASGDVFEKHPQVKLVADLDGDGKNNEVILSDNYQMGQGFKLFAWSITGENYQQVSLGHSNYVLATVDDFDQDGINDDIIIRKGTVYNEDDYETGMVDGSAWFANGGDVDNYITPLEDVGTEWTLCNLSYKAC